MQPKLSYLLRAVVTLAVFASIGVPTLAQNATGAINGMIKDQNDAIIPNSVVTATNKGTGAARKINAGSDGQFWFENLAPGEYEVKVEAAGFSSLTQAVTVQVGSTSTANFSLTVGAVTQVVEVVAEAPVINTTDSNLGGVVNKRQIENLPLNGRSFLSVAGLEPGVTVTYQATSGPGNNNNFFQVSVAGAPQSMTVISVNGARTNDRITGGTSQNFSSESVQEFQISTFGFDLSTGTVSAGAVNIVSRSGSNDFHGSAFYFFRDHNMSAFSGYKRPCDESAFNPLCNDPEARKRLEDPFFVRRQYGATFGGPIKKDKLFFFGNYERSDQVGARSLSFSDPLLFAFNHVAQVPFDQHLVGARLDYMVTPKHTAFLRGNIDKNDSISGTNLESTWIASSNYAYQTQMGLTSVLSPRLVNDFRFSYSYFRNRLRVPTESECASVAGDPFYCFGLGGTRITFFGGLTIGNDTNVTQDRHPRTWQFNDNVSYTRGSHRLRFGGNWEHTYSHGSWNRNAQGTIDVFTPQQVASQNPALYATLPASIKIGFTGPRPTFQELLQLPVNGTLSLGIGDAKQPVAYGYDGLTRNNHIRFYGQDAWQIRPGFTLNFGLGWSFENNVVYHDLDKPQYLAPLGISLGKVPQDYNNFDPALGFAWAVNNKTVLRASASLHHASLNVGFLKLNERILISPAGNGLNQLNTQTVPNPKFGQPGQPATLSFTTPQNFRVQELLDLIPSLRGVLAVGVSQFGGQDLAVRNIELTKTAAGPQNLDVLFDENFATPYTIHFNAGIQREVMRNLSVSADFVQRRGVKFGAYEFMFVDLNRWNRFSGYTLLPSGTAIPIRNPVIPACTPAQRNDPAAQCSNGPILYAMPGILSRYSALQIKVDKRFDHGFQMTGSYALQKYSSFIVGGFSDINDFSTALGDSGLPRHQFTFSGIWSLPKYDGGNKLLRGVFNNWQLSTIVQMSTGSTRSVTLGTLDPEGDGTFVFRLPGTTIGSFGRGDDANDIRKWVALYNARFPAPPDTPVSQIRRENRDSLGTPYPFIVLPDDFAADDSFLTHDLRVTRTIPISEKVRLNLIAEGFNIFNIANLTGYSGTLNAYIRPTATTPGRNPELTFGQPTDRVSPIFGTGGPRAFQLAARVSF